MTLPVFCGQREGTLLGVITKIILKLIPAPEAKATILALFKRVEDNAEVVSGIVAAKIVPSTIEFMDQASIRCSEQANPMGIPEDVEGLLLIEIDGNADAIQTLAQKMRAVLIEHNASDADTGPGRSIALAGAPGGQAASGISARQK